MEFETIHIKTTHDLRPVIELLDQTEEPIGSLMLLIALGAARAAEIASHEGHDYIRQRSHDIMTAAETICLKWGLTHGKN